MKSILSAAVLVLALLAISPAEAADTPIPVVAAENFYGEVAEAIGGDRVRVESIIVAPGTDPHDFEPPPSVARAVADARLVVMNGVGYDHWMEHLVEATPDAGRTVIDVGALVGAVDGSDPHLWYDPRTMPALADALAAALSAIDPPAAADYASRKAAFVTSLRALDGQVAAIRERFAGVPVTASEPVFGLMAEALGLDMRHADFQQAIMNESEPSAASIAAMLEDLRGGKVKVLFYNSQVADPLTEQLLAAAKAGGVPVVPVTESKPAGVGYVDWMVGTLDTVAKALAAPAS